jgi:hypothetical protein
VSLESYPVTPLPEDFPSSASVDGNRSRLSLKRRNPLYNQYVPAMFTPIEITPVEVRDGIQDSSSSTIVQKHLFDSSGVCTILSLKRQVLNVTLRLYSNILIFRLSARVFVVD